MENTTKSNTTPIDGYLAVSGSCFDQKRSKYQYALEQLQYTINCLGEDIRITEEKLHWSKHYKKGDDVIDHWKNEVKNLKIYLKETSAAMSKLA